MRRFTCCFFFFFFAFLLLLLLLLLGPPLLLRFGLLLLQAAARLRLGATRSFGAAALRAGSKLLRLLLRAPFNAEVISLSREAWMRDALVLRAARQSFLASRRPREWRAAQEEEEDGRRIDGSSFLNVHLLHTFAK